MAGPGPARSASAPQTARKGLNGYANFLSLTPLFKRAFTTTCSEGQDSDSMVVLHSLPLLRPLSLALFLAPSPSPSSSPLPSHSPPCSFLCTSLYNITTLPLQTTEHTFYACKRLTTPVAYRCRQSFAVFERC